MDLTFLKNLLNKIIPKTTKEKYLYIGLHTNENPKNQLDKKPKYKSYKRAKIEKSYFYTSKNIIYNGKEILFPICDTDKKYLITHVSIGNEKGEILFEGELSSEIFLQKGIQPRFEKGGLRVYNYVNKRRRSKNRYY